MDRYRRQSVYRTLVVTLASCFVFLTSAVAAPPRYDHVVIVIMENENFASVIGSRTNAPYINTLADGGMSLTRMRAVTHPSLPNYLELFSGNNQGIISDFTPGGVFSTPNLGANLIKAGFTFGAYCDGLQFAGDVTTESTGSGYVRRHCPWTLWASKAIPVPQNQLAPAVHQPFSAFPTDFTKLPTVAFVIPSNLHNMHDLGVPSGDSWLNQNLSAYATWAKTHNSLLIVTWDEDAFQTENLIPTVFFGANVITGTNPGTWSLHNLLRTIEDMYGLEHAGKAALVNPISGVFSGELAVTTRLYTAPLVGCVSESSPDLAYSSSNTLSISDAPGKRFQGLLRFDNVIGTEPGLLPPKTKILSAKLLMAAAAQATTTPVWISRMLTPWGPDDTWNTTDSGIALDDIEAGMIPDFSAYPAATIPSACFDVTGSLNLWLAGARNYGWTLQGGGANTWQTSVVRLELTFIPSSVKFASIPSPVSETAPNVTFTVVRTGDTSQEATIVFTTASASAIENVDYVGTSGTLTWAPNDTSPRQIVVSLLKDTVAEGTESFQLRLTQFNPATVIEGASTVGLNITDSPFDQWKVQKFGSIANANTPQAADLADADSDGATNIIEYSRGTNPLKSEQTPPVVGSIGQYLSISFSRDRAAPDLSYTVQASGDLETWSDGSSYSTTSITSTNAVTTEVSRILQGTVERITVRDNIPVSEKAPRFLRLQVKRN